MLSSYKNLIVWQKSMDLVLAIYELTKGFPPEEKYGLASQMRRSAISIPSNIAEGRYRATKRNFIQFLIIAYSSGAELETQIEIAKRIEITRDLDYSPVDILLTEVMKMLNVMIRKLNPKT